MPSSSFSQSSLSFCEVVRSEAGSLRIGAAKCPAPKRESCGASAVASLWKVRSVSMCARRCERPPFSSANLSSAPDLMRHSNDLRFRFLERTRARKSERSLKGPCDSRSVMIASAIPVPKFLMVVSPNRMVSFFYPATVKSLPLSFTSGGRTGILSRSHSATKVAIASVSPESAVSTAAMYSTG
jgi:hypothetical protein